jgi:hypothetical protein
MEYLSGRMSGKYLPGNPLSYRMKNKSKNKATFVHEYENDKNDFKQEKSNLSCNKTHLDNADQSKENKNDINDSNSNFKNTADGVPNIFTDMNYFNTLFQPFDEKDKEIVLKRKIQEMIKDIERMLCDFYTYERVQILIAEWNHRFDAATDYTQFHRELNDYRTALVNRYLYP